VSRVPDFHICVLFFGVCAFEEMGTSYPVHVFFDGDRSSMSSVARGLDGPSGSKARQATLLWNSVTELSHWAQRLSGTEAEL
jgi:hypothetical protein